MSGTTAVEMDSLKISVKIAAIFIILLSVSIDTLLLSSLRKD